MTIDDAPAATFDEFVTPTRSFFIVTLLFIAVYVTRQTGVFAGPNLTVLDDVLAALAVGLSFRATGVSPRATALHVGLALLAVVVSTSAYATDNETVAFVVSGITSYLLGAVAVVVFRFVLRQRDVHADTLFGAFVVYLAVGLLFGAVYTVIARHDPAAFDPPQLVIEGETSMYYFSFVTLTSLGYGDISPLHDAPRILATLEAIVGAIILTALVGRIVGMLVAQLTRRDAD